MVLAHWRGQLAAEPAEVYHKIGHAVAFVHRVGEAAGFQLPSEPAGLLFLSRSAAAVEQLAGSLGVAFPELEPELVSGAALRRLEPARQG